MLCFFLYEHYPVRIELILWHHFKFSLLFDNTLTMHSFSENRNYHWWKCEKRMKKKIFACLAKVSWATPFFLLCKCKLQLRFMIADCENAITNVMCGNHDNFSQRADKVVCTDKSIRLYIYWQNETYLIALYCIYVIHPSL